MATITSVASGNWSVAGTWDSGVPVDGDSVVIASGHEVVFDVDQSGFANGINGLTITGAFVASTTTGSYYLKMKGNVTGAGTMTAGSSGTPYPVDCEFTILLNGAYSMQLSASGAYQLWCSEPTTKSVKLSANEAAGQTVLSVDADITAETNHWKSGAILRIDDIGGGDTEQNTFVSATANEITIGTAIDSAIVAGAWVHLISRNIKILGVSTASGSGINGGTSGFISAEMRLLLFGVNGGTGHTITGTLSGNGYGVNYGTGHTIAGTLSGNSGGVNQGTGHTITGTVSGNSTGVAYGTGHTITGTVSGNTNGVNQGTGHTITGTVSGNTNGVNQGTGHTITGTVSGNSTGVNQSAALLVNATLSGNTYDINTSVVTAYNTLFGSTTENYLYANLSTYSESLDHDQVAGAFKAWTKGGVTTSVATPVPTGLTASYQIALENASSEGFFKKHLNVPAGKTISLTLHLRKTASMTYLPRAYVHELVVEPISDATGVLHTFTMTDSVDTWESDTYEYTNSAAYDVQLDVTFVGMNATGYVYGQVVDTFAGGGISKARLLGGV